MEGELGLLLSGQKRAKQTCSNRVIRYRYPVEHPPPQSTSRGPGPRYCPGPVSADNGCGLIAPRKHGTEGGNRTHTSLAGQGILSPLRLPVPPPPHAEVARLMLKFSVARSTTVAECRGQNQKAASEPTGVQPQPRPRPRTTGQPPVQSLRASTRIACASRRRCISYQLEPQQ